MVGFGRCYWVGDFWALIKTQYLLQVLSLFLQISFNVVNNINNTFVNVCGYYSPRTD